jgi:hypothetical protein
MSPDKKHLRRWQAMTLAALVAAGGLIAIPQMAAAAEHKTTYCRGLYDPPPCTLTVNAYSDVQFKVTSSYPRGPHRYTVRKPGGQLLCQGTIIPNFGSKYCSFGKYRGRVKITVQSIQGTPLNLSATSNPRIYI